MNLQEDIHAIRQSLESLVRHFVGNERIGTIGNRHRQRHPFVPGADIKRRQYCVRSQQAPRIWGPFDFEEQAWQFLHDVINEGNVYKWLEGTEAERYATFQEIGTYTIEDFHAVN